MKLNLIYKATQDGFKVNDFHSRCDNKGPTISIIKSEFGKTFGGFTNLNWHNCDSYVSSSGLSFIFQLDYNTKQNCTNTKKEIYGSSHSLVVFGSFDICISNSSDQSLRSYCNFRNAYEIPKGLSLTSKEGDLYLAGAYHYRTVDVEVFEVLYWIIWYYIFIIILGYLIR